MPRVTQAQALAAIETMYHIERATFEAWARDVLDASDYDLDRDPDDPEAYEDDDIETFWLGWAARAEWEVMRRLNHV